MSGMAEIACAQGHRVDDLVAEALTTRAIQVPGTREACSSDNRDFRSVGSHIKMGACIACRCFATGRFCDVCLGLASEADAFRSSATEDQWNHANVFMP